MEHKCLKELAAGFVLLQHSGAKSNNDEEKGKPLPTSLTLDLFQQPAAPDKQMLKNIEPFSRYFQKQMRDDIYLAP